MNLFKRPVFTASLGVRLLSLTLGFSAFYASAVNAQTYPSKPIKAIVPFAAGSATDQIARAFAAKMGEILEQPVVVENKAGVNGMLGADAVAKSAPENPGVCLAKKSKSTVSSNFNGFACTLKISFLPFKSGSST